MTGSVPLIIQLVFHSSFIIPHSSLLSNGVRNVPHWNPDARRDGDDGAARAGGAFGHGRAGEFPVRPRAEARGADAGADDLLGGGGDVHAARARRRAAAPPDAR